ncbi:MAG: endonuclease/exonuclease/phosphatase family protein [Acidobacteria bacterium]|nr:endonuclease/exonuclease/phosphatase family protein [Acidobacteriota bacterium]
MRLKTLQWNIGGGRIYKSGADPLDPASYSEDGIDSIVELIRREDPDVITLQETHEAGDNSQPGIIASALGYRFWLNHTTGSSFIDTSMHIGQAVISRYPIISSSFLPFTNPKFEVLKDGELIRSKNGGLTTCIVELSAGVRAQIRTFHMVPFHFFGVDLKAQAALDALSEVDICLTSDTARRAIFQGDFNINSATMREYFPRLFAAGCVEIVQTDPSTPKGKSLDHIIYKGLLMESTRVINQCRTDHFPIVAEFRENRRQ